MKIFVVHVRTGSVPHFGLRELAMAIWQNKTICSSGGGGRGSVGHGLFSCALARGQSSVHSLRLVGPDSHLVLLISVLIVRCFKKTRENVEWTTDRADQDRAPTVAYIS